MYKLFLPVLFLLNFQVQAADSKPLGDFYCDLNYNCPRGMACEDPAFEVKMKNSTVKEIEGYSYFDEMKVEKFHVKKGILYLSGYFQEEPFKAKVVLSKVRSTKIPGSITFGNYKPDKLRCNEID